MTRRLVFYVPRSTQLKVVGPVIHHILEQRPEDYEVFALIPGWSIAKSWYQLEAADFERSFGDRVSVLQPECAAEALVLLKRVEADAVITVCPVLYDIEPDSARQLMAESRAAGISWVSLPHIFEENLYLCTSPQIAESWDAICVTSPTALDFVTGFLANHASDMIEGVRSKMAVCGYTELDGIARMERAAVLRKYQLPADKPIILFATAPLHDSAASKGWQHRTTMTRFRATAPPIARLWAHLRSSRRYPVVVPYRRYLESLRAFADHNGAAIVAKTRPKHRDPHYVRDYVDFFFENVTDYPFTTLELAYVSDFYFGFSSTTALTAVACGSHAFTVWYLPDDALYHDDVNRALYASYYLADGGLWNTPGASRLIRGSEPSAFEALEELAGASLADYKIDERARKRLLDKLVSHLGRSSERVVEIVESVL